ncbi:MAG: hypothetical protein JXC31_01080 [Acholeplasmataceae bacterium]|nr:hypothetical protein [Acholeplasmataceae bacterium]
MSYKVIIKKISVFILAALVTIVLSNTTVFSNRNTSQSPEEITYTIEEPEDMELLVENTNFKFYFRDSTDILAIYDKRSGITHKTGLDVEAGANIRLDCDDAIEDGDATKISETCVPIEDKLNQTWTDFANSLITLEYFDDSLNVKRTSSASEDYSRSSLSRISSDNHWALDVNFNRVNVDMRIHLYFSEKGVEFEIKQGQVTGDGVDFINSIIIAPFLDAQGGKTIEFNGTEYNKDDAKDKPSNDGYIFIPDGPGALLRFNKNQVSISNYSQFIYGRDTTSTMTFAEAEKDYSTPKQMTLPVFGISLGNDKEAAFVAYATAGDEYMKLVAMPYNNQTWYNFAYASFVVNETYSIKIDGNDTGYSTIRKNIEVPTYKIQYHFLAGDGSVDNLPASYVGMALAYKDYLEDNGLEKNKNDLDGNIPIRVDFLMSDVKKALFGYEDVVVTRLSDIEKMYKNMNDLGIKNINSGIIGYRSGGVTAGTVGKSSVSSGIGGKSDMRSLVEIASGYDYDISFYTDYTYITELQYNSLFNLAPAKHISGKYNAYTIKDYQTIDLYYMLRTDKALDWLQNDVKYSKGLDMSSITIDGLTNVLFSEYKRGLSREDNKNLITSGVEAIEELTINAVNPNAYLLNYVDRYLESPLYSSHFLIETDTVPFLQIVLSSNMEMFGHYGNFNITTYNDVLRMIDYNVYPSFILTEQPSYLLVDTNSFLFYSTQYDFYEQEIQDVYNEVNNALKNVIQADWIGRVVLTDGVIMNSYSNGIDIIINYNNFDYLGTVTVDSNSYKVVS